MFKSSQKRGRDKFKNVDWLLNLFVSFVSVFSPSFRKYLLFTFRNVNNMIGLGIRYILIKSVAKKCGDNVSIHSGVYIFSPENLSIGDNVSIHPMSYIDATGSITIKDNVSVAHNVTILSTTHNFRDKKIPIKDQGILKGPTVINDNVWIGAKATILYNTEIGSGAIIGANSLVTKDVEENTVVGGIPAKIIKYR